MGWSFLFNKFLDYPRRCSPDVPGTAVSLLSEELTMY